MTAPAFLPVRPAVSLDATRAQSEKNRRAAMAEHERKVLARGITERLPLPASQVDVPLVARRITGVDFYGGNLQFTACMTRQQMRDAMTVLRECLGEEA